MFVKLHGGTICSPCPIPGAGDGIWVKLPPREPVGQHGECPGHQAGAWWALEMTPGGCRHSPDPWRGLFIGLPGRGDPKSFVSLPSVRGGWTGQRGHQSSRAGLGFANRVSPLTNPWGQTWHGCSFYPLTCPSPRPSPACWDGDCPFQQRHVRVVPGFTPGPTVFNALSAHRPQPVSRGRSLERGPCLDSPHLAIRGRGKDGSFTVDKMGSSISSPAREGKLQSSPGEHPWELCSWQDTALCH